MNVITQLTSHWSIIATLAAGATIASIYAYSTAGIKPVIQIIATITITLIIIATLDHVASQAAHASVTKYYVPANEYEIVQCNACNSLIRIRVK